MNTGLTEMLIRLLTEINLKRKFNVFLVQIDTSAHFLENRFTDG